MREVMPVNEIALCRSFVINQCRNPNGSSGFSSASRENKNRYFTTQSYDATTTQSDLIYTDGAHGLSEIAPTECQNLHPIIEFLAQGSIKPEPGWLVPLRQPKMPE